MYRQGGSPVKTTADRAQPACLFTCYYDTGYTRAGTRTAAGRAWEGSSEKGEARQHGTALIVLALRMAATALPPRSRRAPCPLVRQRDVTPEDWKDRYNVTSRVIGDQRKRQTRLVRGHFSGPFWPRKSRRSEPLGQVTVSYEVPSQTHAGRAADAGGTTVALWRARPRASAPRQQRPPGQGRGLDDRGSHPPCRPASRPGR